jgi:hypothetical protein
VSAGTPLWQVVRDHFVTSSDLKRRLDRSQPMRRRRTAHLSSNRRSTSIVTRRTDASCHHAGWQASSLAAEQTDGSLMRGGRRVMRQRGPSIGDGRCSNTVPPTRRWWTLDQFVAAAVMGRLFSDEPLSGPRCVACRRSKRRRADGLTSPEPLGRPPSEARTVVRDKRHHRSTRQHPAIRLEVITAPRGRAISANRAHANLGEHPTASAMATLDHVFSDYWPRFDGPSYLPGECDATRARSRRSCGVVVGCHVTQRCNVGGQ